MTEQELNEIERLAVDQYRLFDSCVVIALLDEVRRLQLAEKVCKLMQKNMGGHYCVVSKCDNCHTEEVGNAGEVCWTCIEKALKEWEAADNG